MTRMPLVCMQHRRLGVPVRLGADVDAGDDDVDLAAALGERDDPAQRPGHPVHVLGAAVHRDLGAGGQGEPLDRHAQLLGEVERGDHASRTPARRRCPAPWSGRRTAPPGSCPPGSASSAWSPGRRRRRPCSARAAGPPAPSAPVGVEVVLDERAARAGQQRRRSRTGTTVPRAREPLHLLGVLVQRRQRLGRRVGHRAAARPAPGLVGEPHRHVASAPSGLPAAGPARMISVQPGAHASAARSSARTPARSDSGTSIGGQTCRNTRLLSNRCRPLAGPAPGACSPGRRPAPAPTVGKRDHLAVGVPQRRDVADLGQGDQPLVGRVVLGATRWNR